MTAMRAARAAKARFLGAEPDGLAVSGPRRGSRPGSPFAASPRGRAHLNDLLDLLLPPRCAGCGEVGAACCVRCLSAFGSPRRVRRSQLGSGPPVYALADYGDAVRTVVLAYKERGRTELARPLGAVVARGVAALPCAAGASPRWLVPVPSRATAARARGGQHILRVARHCARALARDGTASGVAPALRMPRRVRDSAGLSAAQRVANVSGRVRVVPDGLPPPGSRLVVLDDVVTTGATVAACAAALAGAGFEVDAVLALAAKR